MNMWHCGLVSFKFWVHDWAISVLVFHGFCRIEAYLVFRSFWRKLLYVTVLRKKIMLLSFIIISLLCFTSERCRAKIIHCQHSKNIGEIKHYLCFYYVIHNLLLLVLFCISLTIVWKINEIQYFNWKLTLFKWVVS